MYFYPFLYIRCTYIEKHIIDNKFPRRSSPCFTKSMFYNMPGLEPVQDVYDNERGDQGDRAESDDELSDEEEEITHFVQN